MTPEYIENKDFKGKNFTEKEFQKAEYENCTFTGCIFTKTDLAGILFSECEFENCDLSMANLKSTSFRDVRFKDCKLLGLRFDECDNFLLSFNFEDCIVNFSSFYGLKLKGIKFKGCKLQQVDFAESDLRNSHFQKCDLSGANFGNTNLESSDLQTAANFSIDPEANRIYKAKFSIQNITGRVDDVINVAGHRLSTAEMEEIVSSHPSVAECTVVGIQDDLKGQVPMAMVVLISGESMEHFQLEHEIIQLVREKIGAVAALRNVVIVERLPKTRSGKILRKLLRGIIDKEDYQIPSTIDDVTIIDEIKNALRIYIKDKRKEQKKIKA